MRKEIKTKIWSKKAKVIFPTLIGFVGIVWLVAASASLASIAIEPENSTRSGVALFNDSTASNGSAIRFGSKALNSTYPDVPSNFNVSDWLFSPPWEPNPKPGYPAFRTFCSFSHVAYHDPIVAPGNSSFMHLHAFFGNQDVDQNSTYNSLRTTGNSTCDGGPINRTAYWMPAVFNQQGNVVVPDQLQLYYKAETAANRQTIQPKPNGLRMIAGSPDQRNTLIHGWSCAGEQRTITIPNCNGRELLATIRFPYCWDGKNLDSADHRSHMAYGTNNTWGPCPSSHPIHLPELTEIFHFRNVQGDSSGWYLSSDRMGGHTSKPNGSTLHADWFGAWDNNIQNRWVTNCLKGALNASNGNLCDGWQLDPRVPYGGPKTISGLKPSP